MNRIKMQNNLSLSDAFESFIFSKSAEGVSQKTLSNYKEHLKIFSKYLDSTITLSDLTKKDVQDAISKMRERNISQNTIASYVSTGHTPIILLVQFVILAKSVLNYGISLKLRKTISILSFYIY